MTEQFDGVFRFTNNSDEPFTVLWNNKEYTFPPRSRSPIIIPNETTEAIQEIRKKWAYKWAEREWYKSDKYKQMNSMGNGLPPIRQDADLNPLVQMCLDPLPITMATVEEKPRMQVKSRASKPVKESDNLNAAFAEESRDENIPVLGKQSEKFS